MTLTEYEINEYKKEKDYNDFKEATIVSLKCALLVIGILLLSMVFSAFASANEHAIRTIAYESSDQPFEGQVAVASVIKTRIRDRRWGTTVYDVVYQPFQFSCWDPVTKEPTQSRELTQEELETARLAWETATVGEYNHYVTIHVKPYWIKSSLKSKKIGTHIFHKL